MTLAWPRDALITEGEERVSKKKGGGGGGGGGRKAGGQKPAKADAFGRKEFNPDGDGEQRGIDFDAEVGPQATVAAHSAVCDGGNVASTHYC